MFIGKCAISAPGSLTWRCPANSLTPRTRKRSPSRSGHWGKDASGHGPSANYPSCPPPELLRFAPRTKILSKNRRVGFLIGGFARNIHFPFGSVRLPHTRPGPLPRAIPPSRDWCWSPPLPRKRDIPRPWAVVRISHTPSWALTAWVNASHQYDEKIERKTR